MLLHRLEQRGLRFRRRAIDLIREHHVPKDRPGHEDEPAAFRRLLENLHPGDVRRHEIRRELDPSELQVKDLRDRLHEQRFGQARSAGDQAMPPGKERDQDLLDHLLLADDDLSSSV
jgi:hypothetical protein